MRLETLPLIIGAVLGMIGLALLLDASVSDSILAFAERRRRPRRDRDRPGEALLGLGTLAMAFTFFAGETWRYSVIGVIAGALLLLWGAKRNGEYLRGGISQDGRERLKAPERPRYKVKRKFAEGSRRVR